MSQRQWTGEYRKAVRRSGLAFAEIARRAGVGPRAPERYAKGDQPGHAVAVRLAEVLDAPALVTVSLKNRMRPCPVCHHAFVGHGNRRFCTKACLHTDISRRIRQGRSNEGAVARHRVDRYQAAVQAFCLRCEPNGVCRDRTCELRSVSPLPLIQLATRRAS